MTQFKDFTSFVIRIAFVLGNLTTYYDEARLEIGVSGQGIKNSLTVALHYLEKDENPE